ncbi:MAG: DUF4440 domain-containing protein [Dehalococcoidia bacterium]
MAIQGITDTNSQFIAAIARGDAAGCAAVYPDDGILLPPNAPTFTGRQAIQEFWQGAIDMGVKGANLKTVSLEEHGNTAIEIGAYTLDIQPPDGDATQDIGKYVVIWKRQSDGSWMWAIDIFNSDNPPPA